MKIKIKNEFAKDYISREAGEKLRMIILKAISDQNLVELDFTDLIVASTSFFDEGFAKLINENISIEDFLKFIKINGMNKNDERVLKQVTEFRGLSLTENKVHPWRVCPLGEHWVKEHPRKISAGKETQVDGHCRKNPKGKDILTADEMFLISQNFNEISVKLKPIKEFANENKYDAIISGWCKFWNEVLKPDELLHPDIVKILMATESGFDPRPKVPTGHKAIGLMQVMPETLQLISHKNKELKNHFIEASLEELKDPIINVGVGVRWLYRKYELTKVKLKRRPSWQEVLFDYKGILNDNSPLAREIKQKVENYLKEFSK